VLNVRKLTSALIRARSVTIMLPKKGPKVLVPICVLGAATAYLYSQVPPSNSASKKSDDEAAAKLLQLLLEPPPWVMGAGVALRAGAGVALWALNDDTIDPDGKAS
jgi:hypothetical protein